MEVLWFWVKKLIKIRELKTAILLVNIKLKQNHK
jgi:hypothetical protein